MSIKGFKEVIDNKGYRIDSKDRDIFERELRESLFGTSTTTWNIHGNTDIIEFVLFDANDNQLPQGESGKLVRYISLDDPNIRNYFVINENYEDNKLNGAKEFLTDTELLIREAGYSNGIFKTQITLLNRRVGSETIEYDRVWIHEISPSRTEIRVLPVNASNEHVLDDLPERYDIFTSGGEFRDDTISFVQRFIEKLNVQDALEEFLKIKGRIEEGSNYIDLVRSEFHINDFEQFLLSIKDRTITSMQYWVENRESNISSTKYGDPLQTDPKLQLSIDEIYEKSLTVLANVIEHTLLIRDIVKEATSTIENQETIDALVPTVETISSDNQYGSTKPSTIFEIP